MRSNKKHNAQTTIEYLSTYAWAFLIIIIMVAALSYLGILNPSALFSERCMFSPEVYCSDYIIAENGLQLRLQNNLEETIVVDSFTVSVDRAILECNATSIDYNWNPGQIYEKPILCNFAGSGLIVDDREKFTIDIGYYSISSGSGFIKHTQGELFGMIQDRVLTTTNSQICQNAESNDLCGGLDLVFGIGYQAACCSEHALCC